MDNLLLHHVVLVDSGLWWHVDIVGADDDGDDDEVVTTAMTTTTQLMGERKCVTQCDEIVDNRHSQPQNHSASYCCMIIM
jgi:hypothetical protein